MLPKNRPPTPPGVMLLEEFLKPRGVTQIELAARMGVPVQRVNTIVHGKRGVTADTAILLSEALDTTPELWMGLQADHDLWHALKRRRTKPGSAFGERGPSRNTSGERSFVRRARPAGRTRSQSSRSRSGRG